jgi:hypothetical protein
MPSYKVINQSVLWAIAIVAIDVLVLTLFLNTEDQPIDGLTSVFLIVPAIIGIDLVLAVVLYVTKRKLVAMLLLVNCLPAPCVYNLLAKAHYHHYRQKHFTTYCFKYGKHRFEIELEHNIRFYAFSDVTNQPNGSTWGFVGDYKFSKDSIILIDSTRRPVIIHERLIGYSTKKDTIQLKIKSE